MTQLSISENEKLSTARIHDKHHIILFSSECTYVHKHSFSKLSEAITLLEKVKSRGQVNLEYWEILEKGTKIHNKFLIKKKGKNNKAHIWTGKDTFCKLWSCGGGEFREQLFSLFETKMEKDICYMCVNNRERLKK